MSLDSVFERKDFILLSNMTIENKLNGHVDLLLFSLNASGQYLEWALLRKMRQHTFQPFHLTDFNRNGDIYGTTGKKLYK